MEGILILVGLVFGIFCLFTGKPIDQMGSQEESDAESGESSADDSVTRTPTFFRGGVGASEGIPVLDDDLWSTDGMGQATDIGSIGDFLADRICINPATGLPMTANVEAGFDVSGNLYGFCDDGLSTPSEIFGSGLESNSGFGNSYGSFGGND